MAFADIHIIESEAHAFDGHLFDEVRLTSMGGSLGAKVWFFSHRIEDAGSITPVKRPALKRLLVGVEDDAKAEATVQRVRTKLKWRGEPMACPY